MPYLMKERNPKDNVKHMTHRIKEHIPVVFFILSYPLGIWSFILCVQSLIFVFPIRITFLYLMYRMLYIAMPTRYVLFYSICFFHKMTEDITGWHENINHMTHRMEKGIRMAKDKITHKTHGLKGHYLSTRCIVCFILPCPPGMCYFILCVFSSLTLFFIRCVIGFIFSFY
jgi:hypothetical protein